MSDGARRKPPAPEVIAQPRRRAIGTTARECRQPPACNLAGEGERIVGRRQYDERLLDEGRRDAPRAQLGAQAGGPIAARPPRLHPVAGERRVVDVAPGAKIGDDGVGHIGGRAAADEPAAQVGGGQGPAGK